MSEVAFRLRLSNFAHYVRVLLTNEFQRDALIRCAQKILIQELIPQLRGEGQYRASITQACLELPFDSGLDG
jgi:hypothetical protein